MGFRGKLFQLTKSIVNSRRQQINVGDSIKKVSRDQWSAFMRHSKPPSCRCNYE